MTIRLFHGTDANELTIELRGNEVIVQCEETYDSLIPRFESNEEAEKFRDELEALLVRYGWNNEDPGDAS